MLESVGLWSFSIPAGPPETRSINLLKYLRKWAEYSNEWLGVNLYNGIFLTYQKIKENKYENINEAGYNLAKESRDNITPWDVYRTVEEEYLKYHKNYEKQPNYFSSIYKFEIACSVKVHYVDKGEKKYEYIGYSNPPNIKYWSEDLFSYHYVNFYDDFEPNKFFDLDIKTNFTGFVPSWFKTPLKKDCAINNNKKLAGLLEKLHDINPNSKLESSTGGSPIEIKMAKYGFKNE